MRWVMSLSDKGGMQLTDILRILLLETKATEMIPIVDKETSANRNRGLNTSWTANNEPLTILDKRHSTS